LALSLKSDLLHKIIWYCRYFKLILRAKKQKTAMTQLYLVRHGETIDNARQLMQDRRLDA
jgi:hypothetical protein